jgi:hypothetical protein
MCRARGRVFADYLEFGALGAAAGVAAGGAAAGETAGVCGVAIN